VKRSTVLLALLTVSCEAPTSPIPPDDARPAAVRADISDPWVEEIFIDRHPDPTHAGPGPHPTTESSAFHLTMGGISWFDGDAVEFLMTGTPSEAAANAKLDAISTWDAFVTTRDFVWNDETTQLNPCTDEPSTIVWASIDGPGGIVAQTSTCRTLRTKEIVGFEITMDADEPWATDGSGNAMDVEGVLSHEFGHAAGLGHVNAPKDGCLSLYRFVALGETQKRTLGLGDKLGMAALYGATDTSEGVCGG
jgi:hypothetical protein